MSHPTRDTRWVTSPYFFVERRQMNPGKPRSHLSHITVALLWGKTIKVVLMAGSCEVTRRSDNTIQTLMCWKRMSKVRSHDQIRAKRRSKLGSTLSLVLSSRFINSNKPKVRRHTISIPCRVSAAFAPYRVRPFEFAPTSYRVRPHTFRVRPYQVEFAPWLRDIQMNEWNKAKRVQV